MLPAIIEPGHCPGAAAAAAAADDAGPYYAPGAALARPLPPSCHGPAAHRPAHRTLRAARRMPRAASRAPHTARHTLRAARRAPHTARRSRRLRLDTSAGGFTRRRAAPRVGRRLHASAGEASRRH